jgi:CubicO group peptidase (beta-lactamase class C family)
MPGKIRLSQGLFYQAEYRGFAAEGHGGQFLLVVPEKKLVVVYTAWPYTSGDFFDQGSELMRLIVNSCH